MATKRSKKTKSARKGTQRPVAGQKATRPARKRRARKGKRSNAMAVGSIGVASRSSNVMRPMRSMTARDGHMCRFKGTDFLTSVTIGGTAAAAGDVLYTAVVNPAVLGVSRLATVSKLWERYKFRSCKFRYEAVCPTTTAGQLIGYVDYDTYDDPTGISGAQNLQRAAAHYGEKPVRVWDKTFWEIKDVDPLTDLYVDSDGSDPRWTNQGRLVVLAASAITSSTACGNIYLDYDVEFYIPQLEQTPSTGYGYKLTGGGTMSQAAIFGDASVSYAWSNVGITRAANVFTIPAGSWLITGRVTGTVLALTKATTGTAVDAADYKLTGSDGWMFQYQITSTASFTVTLGGTATTVTGSFFYAALLPSNAITMNQRRLNQVSRMLTLCGEVDSLREAYNRMAGVNEPITEGKECKIPVVSEMASTSASISGSMGATKTKIPLSADDGYFLVKRGSQVQ